jgi:hypothetical protein
MCALPVSGQPPTVIFCVQDATHAADRAPQERLGMQQRPEAHCQATLAAVGHVRTVTAGDEGMVGWPNPRLNHLLFLYISMVKVIGEFKDTRPRRQASHQRDATCAGSRWQGKRETGGSRQPRSLNSGAGDQARRRK